MVITLMDGEERIGHILSDDGREILFLSNEIGKIYIQKENIKSIRPFELSNDQVVHGEYRNSGPFTTRYYFTTNALPIKKKENYAMVHLYGPEIHFATSDRFSVGLMTTWIASPLVFAFKYSIPTANPKVNFGLGTLLGTSGSLNQFRGYGGLHWGMVTFGDRKTNITISAGFSYANADSERTYEKSGVYDAIKIFDQTTQQYYNSYPIIPRESYNLASAPIIGLSGITKIGKNASIFFEGMILFAQNQGTSSYNVYSENQNQWGYKDVEKIIVTKNEGLHVLAFFTPGIRFNRSQSKAFQFAIANVFSSRNGNIISFPIPMCSWFYKF
jgi:hypothetical protein